jgi:hypothetical protein
MNLHLERRARRGEEGMALVMALLVGMIATAMVVASLALATHSGGQSAEQRNATAALAAADYGLQQELASLSSSAGGGVLTPPSCTPINSGSASLLPSTSLPAQWFAVSLPSCSTSVLTRTIISTGYALGEGIGSSAPATPPSTAVVRTVVAHVTLQPAGATSNGGYGFPDAITALKGAGTGAITSTSAFPLSVSGLSGNPVSIRADGPVSLSGGTLTLSSGLTTNSLTGWDNVSLSGTTLTGNVASAKTVTLTNSSAVTGNVLGTTISTTGSTVSGVSRVGTATLPTQPPVPSFPTPADTGWANWTALTGGSVTTTCPTNGTLTGTYVLTATCASAPSAISTGAVAIIVNAAANLTITLPANPGPGPSQLYLVVTNGNLTVTGSGVAVPVFAYASGSISVGGTLVGQLVGGSIITNAATNLLAEPVSTTVSGTPTFPPDFAFPTFGGAVPPLGFVPQINDEYLCSPGATAAC